MADTISIFNVYKNNPNAVPISKVFPLEENYLYFYHTDTLVLLPYWPLNIQDNQGANWNSTSILGRSAPIQSYSSGQARTVSVQLKFHREMLKQTNMRQPHNRVIDASFEEDYVDYVINMLYGCVIPNYSSSAKLVDPPLVAARFGNQTYIKGIVTNFSVGYSGAILRDRKYSEIEITLSMTEINPYDAVTAMGVGSFRSDGEILMSTELNKSTYNIGQGNRTDLKKSFGGK